MADDIRLKRVLINLVNNAIKFTKQGSARLNLSLLSACNQYCQVEFSVIDTGIGIEQEKIAELFKPFKQYDSSTTKCYGGTGLGLSISEQQKITELNQNLLTEISTLEGKTVLIVDDNRINRKIATMALDSSQADILIAENGLEAIKKFKQHHVDIILMDCLMPIMDGYQATKEIRKLEKNEQHTLIFALTASASNEVEAQCISAGMDDIMLKPFKFDVLLNAINQEIANK